MATKHQYHRAGRNYYKISGSLRNNQQLPKVSSTFTKLLHIADPDIQNIFETLTDTVTEYQHALNTCFYIKKSILFERSVIHTTKPHNKKVKVLNSLSQN